MLFSSVLAATFSAEAAEGSATTLAQPAEQPKLAEPPFAIHLSVEHQQALSRRRRISVNNDVGAPLEFFGVDVDKWVKLHFGLFDKPGCQVDSVSWCLGEGNILAYPSKVAPVLEYPGLKKWHAAGIDILKVIVEESKKRNLECFYTHRLNGYDRAADLETPVYLPMKKAHPEWVHTGEAAIWMTVPPWNFAQPGVRDLKLAILSEMATNYDLDGLDLDFSRLAFSLPFGQQWRHRDAMTDFVRRVRLMLQEEAKRRGRPYLLSVRVPDSLTGCHHDGLDIETWIRENLIDIINTGGRSFEVDIVGFRQVIGSRNIKVVPSLDDYHSSDGYRRHSTAFLRGVFANYWHQGADWVQTFNFDVHLPGAATELGYPQWETKPQHIHQLGLFELGDIKAMRFKDKTYAIQRRHGEGYYHWDAYEWSNPAAQLPVTLLPAESVSWRTVDWEKWLRLYVSDDLRANADQVKGVELRLWLSGETASNAVVEAKLNGVTLKPGEWSSDALTASGDALQRYATRLPLPAPQTDGWRSFHVQSADFAVGWNVIGVRLAASATPNWYPKWAQAGRPGSTETGPQKPVTLQKVEAHVRYKP